MSSSPLDNHNDIYFPLFFLLDDGRIKPVTVIIIIKVLLYANTFGNLCSFIPLLPSAKLLVQEEIHGFTDPELNLVNIFHTHTQHMIRVRVSLEFY